MKKKTCKRCKGTGLVYNKPKNQDGIVSYGRGLKINRTDMKGTMCKSCQGQGWRG